MSATRLKPEVLSVRYLPHADARLCQALGLPAQATKRSLAFITCDQDDSLYAALDHATKMAQVEVIYAKSFYAGSAHSSGPYSGEAIGVLAADDPEIVRRGAAALELALAELFAFYRVGDRGPTFFPAVIGSVGQYLAAQASVPVGSSLGYFIAPPIEAMLGLDAALKAADVKLAKFFGPPTETNFAGAYLSGTLANIEASARAFTAAVAGVVAQPKDLVA
jgi:ethanolamine utilization protein EutL